MKKLLPLVALVILVAHARAEDDPRSENEAKTVRAADGTFAKVVLKKDAPAKPADKPATNKPADKPAAGETIDADQVAKLKGMDGKEAKVKGKVHEVFVPASGAVAVLNMGKDFKSCFKVAIFKANFGKFGGLDEIKKFATRAITVEGKVSLYQNLPQIAASVPSQIKVGE